MSKVIRIDVFENGTLVEQIDVTGRNPATVDKVIGMRHLRGLQTRKICIGVVVVKQPWGRPLLGVKEKP